MVKIRALKCKILKNYGKIMCLEVQLLVWLAGALGQAAFQKIGFRILMCKVKLILSNKKNDSKLNLVAIWLIIKRYQAVWKN